MTLMLPAAVLVTEAASSSNLSFTPLYTLVHEYLPIYLALWGLNCLTQDLLRLVVTRRLSSGPALDLVAPVTCGILVPRPGMEPTSPAL